jgi:hypothetical protein
MPNDPVKSLSRLRDMVEDDRHIFGYLIDGRPGENNAEGREEGEESEKSTQCVLCAGNFFDQGLAFFYVVSAHDF